MLGKIIISYLARYYEGKDSGMQGRTDPELSQGGFSGICPLLTKSHPFFYCSKRVLVYGVASIFVLVSTLYVKSHSQIDNAGGTSGHAHVMFVIGSMHAFLSACPPGTNNYTP